MSMPESAYVYINADYRGSTPSLALRVGGQPTIEQFTDENAFVDRLQYYTTVEKKKIVSFNGIVYIFSDQALLGGVSAEKTAVVKELALQSIDILCAFFARHGFRIQRRNLSIVMDPTDPTDPTDPPKQRQFPCFQKPKYDHQHVLAEVEGIMNHLRQFLCV